MELAELYSRGTRLADVKPDFRGMKWREWQLRNVTRWAVSWLADHAGENPLKDKKISTPRDNYGWRSIGAPSTPSIGGS